MPTHGGGALGSLNYTPDERKALAKRYSLSLLNHTCILDQVLTTSAQNTWLHKAKAGLNTIFFVFDCNGNILTVKQPCCVKTVKPCVIQ